MGVIRNRLIALGALLLGGWVHGLVPAPLSQRSVINVNFVNGAEYQFINHFKNVNTYGPFGAAFATGASWNQLLDSNGYPNNISADNKAWGGGLHIPDSNLFAGPYILTWTGEGRFQFQSGTWTRDAASTNCTQNANGDYSGVDSRCIVTYAGAGTSSAAVIGYKVLRTNPNNNGKFVTDMKFYRQQDETDLLAGKVFRAPWKQTLVDLNPSAIRFMNWNGGNNGKIVRFDSRTLPSNASWTGGGGLTSSNWVASPAYGETTGTNQYALAGVTGTPVAMQHGELATARIGNGMVRAGVTTITAITKANPGAVTSVAHGYQTGDQLTFRVAAGMTQLNYVATTITVSDADHYTIGIDTTSFGTFSSGTANQFITLNVGTRGTYPVVFPDGHVPASNYGNAYIAAADYKTFYFDKTISAQANTSGVFTYGAWVFNDTGASNAHDGGVPLEVCTALINELNAMGPQAPISMYVTMPAWSLMSGTSPSAPMDPDYSSAQNYAVKAVDVILNGANGYAGLVSSANLFIQFSNETWNPGFYQTQYLAWRGALRWPTDGLSDFASMSALRSFVMVQDLQAAYSGNSRIKYVLAGQGTAGIAGGINFNTVYGTTFTATDVLNPGAAQPMQSHDYFAWAAYFVPSSAYDTANLTTISDAWLANAGNPTAQEANSQTYVTGGFVNSATGGNETTQRYGGTLLPAYAAAMQAFTPKKSTIMYEGGWDRSVTSGTTNQNNFLASTKRSQAWATALVNYFNQFQGTVGAAMPSDYIELDQRWGHSYPTLYGSGNTLYPAGTEGSGLDQAWLDVRTRNLGLQ